MRLYKIFICLVIFLTFGAIPEGQAQHEYKDKKYALICVKGINPRTPPAKVRELFYFFRWTRIPFVIEVAPIDYASNSKTRLSENVYLVRNINALLSLGGSAVLASGDLSSDKIIDEQIDELVKSDIIPLAFVDSGARGASRADYFINNHFSTMLSQAAGYAEENDARFQNVYHLNYKFPAGGSDTAIKELYEQAQGYLSSEGKVFGISFDLDLDKVKTQKLTSYLYKLGYQFMDLKLMPNYVRSENTLILSSPDFYAKIPYQDIVYADKRKIDLVKFSVKDKALIEQLADVKLDIKFGKLYDRLSGTALLDVPEKSGIYIVRQAEKKPSRLQKYKKLLVNIAFGKTATTPIDNVSRAIVWLVFIMTIISIAYLINLFYIQLKVNTYREY